MTCIFVGLPSAPRRVNILDLTSRNLSFNITNPLIGGQCITSYRIDIYFFSFSGTNTYRRSKSIPLAERGESVTVGTVIESLCSIDYAFIVTPITLGGDGESSAELTMDQLRYGRKFIARVEMHKTDLIGYC